MSQKTQPDRILRPMAAARMLGVAKTKFYDLAKSENFPRAIILGARARGYLERELDEWLAAQPRAKGGAK